jgi:hypothetical protein
MHARGEFLLKPIHHGAIHGMNYVRHDTVHLRPPNERINNLFSYFVFIILCPWHDLQLRAHEIGFSSTCDLRYLLFNGLQRLNS